MKSVVSVSNQGEEKTIPFSKALESGPKFHRGLTGKPSQESSRLLVSGAGDMPRLPAFVDEDNGAFAKRRKIIGTDDRRPIVDPMEFPWKPICALKGKTRDGRTINGTGWLAGPRTVITAGHCVHHPDFDDWVEHVTVIPACDDETAPYGSLVSTSFSAPKTWIEDRDQGSDIAVIHLPWPIHGDLRPFGFAALEDDKFENQLVNITGYPKDKGGDQMWQGRDRIFESTPELLRYETDTVAGQSGSPAFMIFRDPSDEALWMPLVVGIHSRSGSIRDGAWQDNCAVRITPEIFDLIEFWIEQSAELDSIPQLVYVPGEVVLSAPAQMKRAWDARLFGHSIGTRSILLYYNDLIDDLNKPLVVGAPILNSILDQIEKEFGPDARDFVKELSRNVQESGDKPLLFGIETTLQWLILATTYFFGSRTHEKEAREKIKERFREELTVVGRNHRMVMITRGFGTVIAYDALIDDDFPTGHVERLITLGNPLAYPAITKILRSHLEKRGRRVPRNETYLPYPDRVSEWKDIAINGDPVAAETPCCNSKWSRYERLPPIKGVSEEMLQRPLGEAYLVQEVVNDLVCDPLPRGFDAPLQNFLIANNLADRMAERDNRMAVLIELNFDGEMPLHVKAEKVVEILVEAYLKSNSGSKEDLLAHLKISVMERYVAAELLPREVSIVERRLRDESSTPIVHRIWQNSRVQHLLDRSRSTIQADAAETTYQANGAFINWAVLDTGVDQSHLHFHHPDCCDEDDPTIREVLDFTQPNLVAIEPALEISAPLKLEQGYTDPSGHGTHVAGIIAGKSPCGKYSGVSPQTRLYCYKVLNNKGRGDEAAIIRALEHIYNKNSSSYGLKIHGVNVSLGCEFDPTTYGCGHSAICTELRRLWNQGVVVCVAAGNAGRMEFGPAMSGHSKFMNLDMSVGDPANLEEAISVGSIHKYNPHTYGISYFSSKGPTADGRIKPDCVAPGEKIISADAGGITTYRPDSGTSMACPHVSGMIASFLSRRREFIGQPDAVKKILLENCTDLNRDKFHQGAGMPNLMKMLANT